MTTELEELKAMIQDQQRQIERMEAVNAIQNVLSKYAAYHVASDQQKTAELSFEIMAIEKRYLCIDSKGM